MTDTDRRTALAAALAAATAATLPAAAMAAPDPAAGLEAAFRAAFTAPADAPTALARARQDFLAEAALMIDHDVPFAMDRTAAADHLAFHAANWQRLEIILSQVTAQVHGETGIVSAFFNLRGKPKDAGFRLRPGFVSAVCTRTPAGWKALSLHLSPLAGQILDASPS
ncbi:nuclear transport factor 2 family protein [Sandaracinobacteroides saxicola]|uniref:Nuclear transport factor 2 family protein n=1 Tax=Sandaracinobacteroides saxicola TaxID=2759707 RepID=A0A7G5II83_9SPHN|nr:nuclear transport factor 2 family protein [Sandaracinobacteroides saxicola]QMW23075.1 nuclear transport factor 2 family protein [Sandaracinobacteroides saxicola]